MIYSEAIRNMFSKVRNTVAADGGFSLLEALVIVALLGLVIAFLAPPIIREFDNRKILTARHEIKQLSLALDSYDRDVGSYPTTAQGVASLVARPPDVGVWKGPYLTGEQSLEDPWNQPWVYRAPSARAHHKYDLCFAGLDGSRFDPAKADAICNP